MSSLFNLDNLISKVKAYLENRIELAKMEAKEEVGKWLAGFLPFLILLFLGLFIILFLSLTLSFLISDYYDIPWLGFACMTIIYFIFFLIFYFIKDNAKFKNKLNERISRHFK